MLIPVSLNNENVIPRNHKVEEVLNEANNGNIEPFNKFLEVLNKPYLEQKNIINYQIPLFFQMKNIKLFVELN